MSNQLQTIINSERAGFFAVLSDKNINFEREAKFALQALEANSYLANIAKNNEASLRNAILNIGAIGISLNPASKLAYLVPRKSAVCLDISYMGLMHIAQDSGAIAWGQCLIVREKDDFSRNGIDQQPTHKFNEFGGEAVRGKIVGVYVTIKTLQGDYLTHSMPIGQVHDIRNRSESYKAYLKDKSKLTPWVTDEEEMIKKTCIKQAFKLWPSRTNRLEEAVEYMNNSGEGIDFSSKQEIVLSPEQEALLKDMQDKALDGTQALENLVTSLNAKTQKGTKERADFSFVWSKHGQSLKDAAKASDASVVTQ